MLILYFSALKHEVRSFLSYNLANSTKICYTYDVNCKLSKLLMRNTNGVVTKYVYGRGLISAVTGAINASAAGAGVAATILPMIG